MSFSNQADEIEEYKEDLEKQIERANMLKRLMENKDFKELFLQHYFIDEAARCVALRHTDEALHNQTLYNKVDLKIIGIGECQKFVNAVLALGAQAENQIQELEDNQ